MLGRTRAPGRQQALLIVAGFWLLASCASNGTAPPSPELGGDGAHSGTPTDHPGAKSSAGSGNPHTDAPASTDGPDTGSMNVTVTWLDAPAAARRPAGRNSCGVTGRPPVTIHTLGGVSGALVTVASTTGFKLDGERSPAAPAPIELIVASCRVDPMVALADRGGAAIELASLDENRHRVRVTALRAGDFDQLIDMPIAGARASVELPGPGTYRVARSDPSQNSAVIDPGYVVIPGPGSHKLTDERGLASFSQVPAGTYRVRVWHPPVPGSDETGIERSRTVTIAKGSPTELEISLGTRAQ